MVCNTDDISSVTVYSFILNMTLVGVDKDIMDICSYFTWLYN
jgi:hypothetical protein